jgi:hypothetical protein
MLHHLVIHILVFDTVDKKCGPQRSRGTIAGHGTLIDEECHRLVLLDKLLLQEGLVWEKAFLTDQEHMRQKVELKNFVDLASSSDE